MTTKPLRLTNDNCKDIPETTTNQWYRDDKIRGFYACKFPTGTLAFYLRKTVKGKEYQERLGKDTANLKANKAEELFIIKLGEITSGTHVTKAEQKTKDKGLVTLRMARDAKMRYEPPGSVRGQNAYGEIEFDPPFEEWLDLPIADLRKSMIRDKHHRITRERGPTAANHALVSLKCVINFAFNHYEEDEIGGQFRNPADGVKKNKERKHAPAWKASDFPEIWKAFGKLPNLEHGDFFRFMSLTAMRPGTDETSDSGALYLKWEFINFDQHYMEVPGAQTKNGERLLVPLVADVEDILTRQRDRLEAKFRGATLAYVWPQLRKPDRAPTTIGNSIALIRELTGFHFVPKDCRHFWNECAKPILKTEARKSLGGWKLLNVDEQYGMEDPEVLRPHAKRIVADLMRRAERRDDVVIQMRA